MEKTPVLAPSLIQCELVRIVKTGVRSRTHDHGASKVFPNHPSSIRAARELVGELLQSLGLDDGLARIVTSELATKAVRNDHAPFRLSIAVVRRIIRIEVEDGVAALVGSDEASDRGWRIVEAAAVSWGIEDRGETRAVWIELPAEQAA